MAVANTDIKFYHALQADGGDIDTGNEIISGVLNSFIGDVSASNSESGIVKHKKFFIKNEHATDSAYVSSVGLSTFSLGDDLFTFYEPTNNTTIESEENFASMRRYGVAHCTGELSSNAVPIEFEDPTIATELIQVGDKVTFFDQTTHAKIATATCASITSTLLAVTEDLSALTLDGTYVSSVVNKGEIPAGSYIGFWLEQIVKPYSAEQLSNTMNLTFYFDPVA